MTPDPLDAIVDEIVDEVAGSLTAGEPRAGFTSRVMARIESSDAPRRGWRRAWLLVPLSGAAVLAIVFVRGPERTAPQSRESSPVARGLDRTPAGVARGLQPGDRGPERAPLRDTNQAAPHVDRAAPQRVREPYALDPLVTAGIGVAPLTIDRLASDPIAIDRIDPIASVDVAPLTIDDPQRRQE